MFNEVTVDFLYSKEVSRRQKTLASWFTKSGSGGVSKSDSNVTAQPPQKKPRKS